MRESPLKIAVLGLNDAGRSLLDAAKGLDCFTIAAVGDTDTNLAQQVAKDYNCAAYDDYRRLIIQNQLDCLLVAAPIHNCAEYLKLAIKKKFHILKLPPLARNFSETAEFVKMAQNDGVTLAAANPGRFAQSALAARGYFLQNPAQQPFLILAAAGEPTPGTSRAKWRDDPVLAGGGAILYDCWEIIDQIILNFGLPQQVYCVAGSTAGDRQQRLYRTEDSAIITMKFGDAMSGNLLAGHASVGQSLANQQQKWLIAQCHDTIVRCDDKVFEIADSRGQRLRQDKFADDSSARIKMVLENFGSHLLWPDKNPLVSPAADNLKIMAFIEAAYLSARTGMPEEPARILKIA
ncbi:MAG: Gfo/Idh/MocA family oxidoreductase [Sedimentisphaerales bacterium]|jgi:predicted dehydrogenase